MKKEIQNLKKDFNKLKRNKFHHIDVYVGGRLREKRKSLHMSQRELGDRLGLTFQQVQKYENGQNRMGSSRLYELSLILKVPTAYFFEYHEFLSKDIGNKKQLLKDIHGVINLFESVKSESIRKNMIQAVKSVFKTAMEFEDE